MSNKKNIYLVQAGCLYGDTYYLPYAVGMLAAYAFNDEHIAEEYELKRIIYSLEDIDESIEGLDNPFFVGFSNSIWNYQYNLEYAERLKSRYPECIIEFGGHHIPPSTEYLDKYSFIDILIHRKGEEAFKGVLEELTKNDPDFSAIPNISFRTSRGIATQTPEKQITISDYPSPYLNGVFDDIIKNKNYRFSCVLETNRGCPYNCCYCDWGELNSKVRLFPLEKVLAELEWMSENKMEFVYCVDANFGMFPRDEIIARKLAQLKTENGYPNRLQVSYSKSNHDRVFRINKLLADHGIGKGATLALQSLSPDVLDNIGRTNISREEYASQIARYRDAGISTYTELILGLPGETYESFTRGLCEILELGQHSSVSAYYCELLPNSLLSTKEYIDKFKIKTVSTSLNQYHCENMDNMLSGFSSIIVETATMSVRDWIRANEFSTCVQSMHHFGILQCVAMYIRHEYDVSYYDFYTELYSFILNESVFLKNIFEMVSDVLNKFVSGQGGLTYQAEPFGKITYPLEEAVFLLCLYDFDLFLDEISVFVRRYIKDEDFLNQLLRYQKSVVLRPTVDEFKNEFEYDFEKYFGAILRNEYEPLKKENTLYKFSTPFRTEDWTHYAREIVWYGRRNGRMLYSAAPNRVEKTD